jgi:hypothetical protein
MKTSEFLGGRMSIKSIVAVLLPLVCLTACTMVAPAYRPSLVNAQQLKNLPAPLALGEFSAERPDLEEISIRGNTMVAGQGTFSAYLKDAIKNELNLVSMLGTGENAELTAVLLVNELNTGNTVRGDGNISARFSVKKDQVQSYNKVLNAATTFPSSFIGAHAIPNAANAYPGLVQRLLEALYADQEFLNSGK